MLVLPLSEAVCDNIYLQKKVQLQYIPLIIQITAAKLYIM